jgi:hypothetical protein
MPRRAEFMPDARAASRGVIVNAPGWQEALEANTRAFMDNWVARPEFKFEYDQLSAAEFVDRVAANAGIKLDGSVREGLFLDLLNGRRTRAQVLRTLVEDAEFQRREFRPAFVLMQYFGYLRRNPDDPPDASFAGYDFWLSKLDEFHGNYAAAEMVKAFITSTEYRARFGP